MKRLRRIKRRFVLFFKYKKATRSERKRKAPRAPAAGRNPAVAADENSPFGAAMDYVEVLITYAHDMEGELESGSVKRSRHS